MTADDALHIKQPLAWQLLVEFSARIGSDGDDQVVERVTGAVRDLGLRPVQMAAMRQSVLQALRNAATLGNQGQRNLAVSIRVWVTGGYAQDRPRSSADATPGSQQDHRGWGVFLVQRQGDDPQASNVESRHEIELFLYHEDHSERRRRA